MDVPGRDAGRLERGFGGVHHRRRAANECRVDARGRHQGIEELRAFFLVQQAVEQIDFLRFVADHVVQRQAVQVAVLEVLEFFGEHDAREFAIAVDQGEAAARLRFQRGHDQREHRRDAAAAREGDVVPGARRVERGEKPAIGCHHLERLAGSQGAIGPGGKAPARNRLDADPQLARALVVRYRAADRI